jgi:hypothetical protein
LGLRPDVLDTKDDVREEIKVEKFELKHDKGRLIAIVVVNGVTYEKDVTEHFEGDNAHDDWLDFRLGL